VSAILHRRQEAVRLLTAYQEQVDEWASFGDSPLAALGVGVQQSRPQSVPLLHRFPTRDFRRAERLLSAVAEVNPVFRSQLETWAAADFKTNRGAAHMKQGVGAFKRGLREALISFETVLVHLPEKPR
tara:strand:- start:7781 stop:8164 length:384 start_codon:yes stop_codon:yes gene_type:complete